MLSFRHPRQQRRYCRSKRKLFSLKIRIRSLLNMLAFLFNLKNLKKNDCPLSILKLPRKKSFRRMKNTFSSFETRGIVFRNRLIDLIEDKISFHYL